LSFNDWSGDGGRRFMHTRADPCVLPSQPPADRCPRRSQRHGDVGNRGEPQAQRFLQSMEGPAAGRIAATLHGRVHEVLNTHLVAHGTKDVVSTQQAQERPACRGQFDAADVGQS